ncbi:MAG TPA: zf-HC2 domain-containing protein [Anaerolineae bacterium]|nr:zf-HC2 domain-containing protein [Anaerolineae bacterium]
MTNDEFLLNQIEQAKALLSPYLDGEVTDAERKLVQAALSQSPELQADLESLQQTVTLLGEMPRASAPRPFTLTQADVGRAVAAPKKTGFFVWLKPLMGAAAALAAVFVVGMLALLNTGSTKQASQVALAPAAPEMAQEAKMEAPSPTLDMQRAAPVEAAEAPTKSPEQPAAESADLEKTAAAEMTGETFAAPSPARKSAGEVPPAAEKAAESSAAMEETAPEAAEAGATAITAETAMEEAAPLALDAAPLGAVNSTEGTAGDAAGDAAKEPALPPAAATQITEAAEADAALPQTTTLFVPLAAQENSLSGELVSPPPTPAPAVAKASPEPPAGQTQTGAMALAIGLAVMGLLLVFVVAIFLIVKRK